MKALVLRETHGEIVLETNRPIPAIRDGYLLVRTVAVSLIQGDPIMIDVGIQLGGNTLGCDWAGVVEEVGPGVTRPFKKGDRVYGCNGARFPSSDHENGAFADVILCKGDLAMHIPEGVDFEKASALGVAVITVGRCLNRTFNLPLTEVTDSPRKPIFVYGGSTSVGTLVIQFAKLANLEVITVSSPHNFELLRSYGADHIFDYHDEDAPGQVKSATQEEIKLCVDCIGKPAFCDQIMAPGGIYSSITPERSTRDDITTIPTLGYDFYGETTEFLGQTFPPNVESFEFSRSFARYAERLLAQGKIMPHPIEVRRGGLAAIPSAYDELRQKKVSGKKLVYRVDV